MVSATVPFDAQPAIEAAQLTMRFPRKRREPLCAIDDLSLTVKPRQVTGLVGPDGAGKTTLLRLCAGLLKQSSGTLHVRELDTIKDAAALRQRIGYMPQKFGLYEDLTVRENLDLFADLQGVSVRQRPNRYERLLTMTGLDPFTQRLAGRLSGGMKQKLGLACCFVKSPDLLLLDEPTVGVDPVSRRDLWKIIHEFVKKDGISILLSTAYLDEAEHCHHVLVLHEGRLLSEGTPARFHERVQGRTYLATPTQTAGPRALQAAAMAPEGVVDATIRRGNVRIVHSATMAHQSPQLPPDLCAELRAAEPEFEDAFVDLLADAGVRPQLPEESGQAAEAAPTSADQSVVVSVTGLVKCFGDFTAVRDIGFEVRRGEIFGLLGPNGAGKSTTFRMLCGLLAASGGEIRVAGYDLRRVGAKARARIGYMAQKFSLYQQLPVTHNLRFYGKAYGLCGRRLNARIDWALREFDLRTRKDVAAGSLPGGYRQRLAMAAAMLHEPDILFLDEPTSGADPLARREFWLRINSFARAGVTVIVTTHFMEEAEYCDRLLIMSRGRELAQGTPEQIRRLARSEQAPDPTMEQAFIALAEAGATPAAAGGDHG